MVRVALTEAEHMKKFKSSSQGINNCLKSYSMKLSWIWVF